jgi:hypothetical protein
MRASEEEREESNALHQAMGTKEPYPRSIVKSVPLPRSFKDETDIDLMISEDGIVALEVRSTKTMRLYLMAARLMPTGCRRTLPLAANWFICSHSDEQTGFVRVAI